MPSEKNPSREKPEKKPSDCVVARHFAENNGCALAYSDNSFRVASVCPLSANLEIMEALYIKALAPNLCVQKSSIAHIHLFRHRQHHVSCDFFFLPTSTFLSTFTVTVASFFSR